MSNSGDVCAYLLGTMLGVLGHQRGTPPLHASVIDFSEGCIALVGEKGAGKSTLAASLARRGHRVIADDVCFLQLDHSCEVRAWPGSNRVRLWEDAMVALGCGGAGLERDAPGCNKYFIPVGPAPNSMKPRCLRRSLCASRRIRCRRGQNDSNTRSGGARNPYAEHFPLRFRRTHGV